MLRGQERQSGRTPWRAASLCGERKALWRVSDTVPEAGFIGKKKKRINTKYGLDIHYYRSAAAGSGVALL